MTLTPRQTLQVLLALAFGVFLSIAMSLWNRFDIANDSCRIAVMETRSINAAAEIEDTGCEAHVVRRQELVRIARVRDEK